MSCVADSEAPQLAGPVLPSSGNPVSNGPDLVAVEASVSVPGGVRAAFALEDGRVLLEAEEWIHRWSEASGLERSLIPRSEVGDLIGAAPMRESLLVAGSRGVIALTADGLYQPELDAALEGHRIIGFDAGATADEVWILTDLALFILQETELSRVDLPGLAFSNGALRVYRGDSETTVYIRDGSTIYSASRRAGGIEVSTVLDAPSVSAFDVDHRGALWVADLDGFLHRRDALGRWTSVDAVSEVQAITASRASDAVWITTAEGLFFAEHRSVHSCATETLPGVAVAAGGGTLISGGAEGTAWTASPRHRISLRPLEEGEEVFVTRTVFVESPGISALSRLSVRVAGQAQTVDLMSPSFEIAIDPDEPVSGEFTVEIEAEFSDGTLPVQRVVRYLVPGEAPSWITDISPIAQEHCNGCHGAASAMAGARKLETRQEWVDAFTSIEYNVVSGSMPKAPNEPLPDELVRRIVAWGMTGFSE